MGRLSTARCTPSTPPIGDRPGSGRKETLQPGVPRRPPVEERMPMLSAPTAKVTPQGVHQWLSEFGWDVDSRRAKYPTKYKFNKNTKEQFKLIVREYSRMEEEKDSRQFGSLLDSLARLSAGSR